FIGEHACAARPFILELLNRSGIATIEVESRQENDAALLFAESARPEVLEFVEQFSAKGLNRLLVLGVHADCLKSDALCSLLSAWASDVLRWEATVDCCSAILARLERWKEIDHLARSAAVADRLIGRNPRWIVTLRNIVEIARFTAASVLITGESGTGKELVA